MKFVRRKFVLKCKKCGKKGHIELQCWKNGDKWKQNFGYDNSRKYNNDT